MNLESRDIKKQKLDELKKIFPEIFMDETINYEKLKDILDGDNVKLNLHHNLDLETLQCQI